MGKMAKFFKKISDSIESFQDNKEQRDLKKLSRLKTQSKLQKEKLKLDNIKSQRAKAQSDKYDSILGGK